MCVCYFGAACMVSMGTFCKALLELASEEAEYSISKVFDIYCFTSSEQSYTIQCSLRSISVCEELSRTCHDL